MTQNLAGELLFGGKIAAGLDPLSAFFLVPVFVLGMFAALYGRHYMMHYAGSRWLGPPWIAFDFLIASLAMVLLARDALSFLFSWELMSLSAYTLVAFEHEIESTRRAGWVYLIASHIAMAILFITFLLLGRQAGSLEFASIVEMKTPDPGIAGLVFFLAVLGFGIKAGFVPMHVWLPEAHAAAPSHVSAVMSGVLIKMGIYGILRTVVLLHATAAWWGSLLMIIGIFGGIFGISIALYQRDLKRVFAYSSVENIGIVALGIGIGLWGASANEPRIAALGIAGALFHIWNHALM